MAVHLGAAGEIHHQIGAAAAGRLAHLAREVGALQADFLDAEAAQQLQPFAAAAGGEHAAAELAGELHGEAPHAARGAGDEHGLAGREAALGHQIGPGGEARLGDGGAFDEREIVRNRHELPGGDGGARGMGAAAHQSHHPRAGLPGAPLLRFDDDAGALEAGNRALARGRRIETAELQQIRVVQTRGLDGDEDLARPG
jgi:hypothetical protein